MLDQSLGGSRGTSLLGARGLDLGERIRSGRRRPLASGDGEDLDLDRRQIERLVPHRGRFLLLDRVSTLDREAGTLTGTRRLAANDRVFADHFPADPIYPGVLLLECAGQLGLCLVRLLRYAAIAEIPPSTSDSVRALRVHHAVFLSPARPDDLLEVQAEVIWDDGLVAVCAGQISCNRKVVGFAVLEVLAQEPETFEQPQQQPTEEKR